MTTKEVEKILRKIFAEEITPAELIAFIPISKSTLYKYLKEENIPLVNGKFPIKVLFKFLF